MAFVICFVFLTAAILFWTSFKLAILINLFARCALRVARYVLRVARYVLRVSGYGLRVARCGVGRSEFHT
jgi:hypothetical protein